MGLQLYRDVMCRSKCVGVSKGAITQAIEALDEAIRLASDEPMKDLRQRETDIINWKQQSKQALKALQELRDAVPIGLYVTAALHDNKVHRSMRDADQDCLFKAAKLLSEAVRDE